MDITSLRVPFVNFMFGLRLDTFNSKTRLSSLGGLHHLGSQGSVELGVNCLCVNKAKQRQDASYTLANHFCLLECYSVDRFERTLPFTFYVDRDYPLCVDSIPRSLILPLASHSTSLHPYSIRTQVFHSVPSITHPH